MFRVLGLICAALLAAAMAVVPAAAVPDPGAAPAGFLPSSTSWIDDNHGFVLGFAPCPAGQCPALLRTSDGGATWSAVGAPDIPLTTIDSRPRVHFATALDGLITDGQALFTTHTGGHSWHPVHVPGDIGAIASNDLALYAIVSDSTGTRLYTSPVAVTSWTPVPGVELPGAAGRGTITAHGTGAHVVLNIVHQSIAYWSTTSGQTWQSATPPCDVSANPELSQTGATVFALCSFNPGQGFMFKDLLSSAAFAPFSLVSHAPEPGITTAFAAASPGAVTIAAIGGAAFLHHTADAGTTWTTPLFLDELPLVDLAFTSDKTGTVVWGGPLWGDARVYQTHDGGATWTPLAIN